MTEQETGTIRETFFNSQLNVKHQVRLPREGDFLVDDTFVFEIGGKSKAADQIKHLSNAFLEAYCLLPQHEQYWKTDLQIRQLFTETIMSVCRVMPAGKMSIYNCKFYISRRSIRKP